MQMGRWKLRTHRAFTHLLFGSRLLRHFTARRDFFEVNNMPTQRLDKFISDQRIHSRADATKVIRCGLVTVNELVCRDASKKINPETDVICFKGEPVSFVGHVYLMMNKPGDVLCVSNDKTARTIIDLLPEAYQHRNLFPAGRLDKTTTGLVLITDDGEWAHKIISPKNEVWKTYIAELDAPVNDEIIKEFSEGTHLPDGTPCEPAIISVLDSPLHVKISIHEGKYHQVKRMFGTYDIGVNRLHRQSIGGVELDDTMHPGEFRPLTSLEIVDIINN